MEYLIISVVCLILVAILNFVFGVKMKELKNMTNIKELDDIADKYPSNIKLCKEYLKKLNNEKVKIEEDEGSDATVYVAITDKICIGNLKKSYSRIQTIAHECLHSIQNRTLLVFNFVFSNIYLLYFIVILILGFFRKLYNPMAYITGLCLMGLVYICVRMYLENDAMIKARFLAKEYMEEKAISTKEQIEKLVAQFDKINDLGIRAVHFKMLSGILIKVAIISLICFWR